MSDNLRSKVIRLAHANPALRPHLLPLLGVRTAADKSFEEAVEGRTFTNPDTGNKVQFSSLPSEEQKKIRDSWEKKNEGGGSGGGEKKKSEARKTFEEATKAFEKHKALEDSYSQLPDDAPENARRIKEIFSRFATGNKERFSKEYPRLEELLNTKASDLWRPTSSDLGVDVERIQKELNKFKKEINKNSGQLDSEAKQKYEDEVRRFEQSMKLSEETAQRWENEYQELEDAMMEAQSFVEEEEAEDGRDGEDDEEPKKKTASFRSRAIRLAYWNPKLRPYLLPLLK